MKQKCIICGKNARTMYNVDKTNYICRACVKDGRLPLALDIIKHNEEVDKYKDN